MSLFRYFGEQGPEHNGNLFWSEALGRFAVSRHVLAPLLTQDELDSKVRDRP